MSIKTIVNQIHTRTPSLAGTVYRHYTGTKP